MKAIILGRKITSRTETIKYVAEKFDWKDVFIGISHSHAFWAWIMARLTGKKCIYYCIDFYSPKMEKTFKGKLLNWVELQLDKFLVRHCDIIWDISERINEGRAEFGHYSPLVGKTHKIVPLAYPSAYFRFRSSVAQNRGIFIGLDPYGLELMEGIDYLWLGKGKMSLEELLDKTSQGGFGISLWKEKGNNYYGDPGKTKLYSACGLPVIMTNNTPYAKIIKETQAGLVINYSKIALRNAISEIVRHYNFYKNNVKKTWRYIDADQYRNLLE